MKKIRLVDTGEIIEVKSVNDYIIKKVAECTLSCILFVTGVIALFSVM